MIKAFPVNNGGGYPESHGQTFVIIVSKILGFFMEVLQSLPHSIGKTIRNLQNHYRMGLVVKIKVLRSVFCMFKHGKVTKVITGMMLATMVLGVAGCSSNASSTDSSSNTNTKTEKKDEQPIKVAFYPNESATEFETTRSEIQKVISEATDRDVEIVTSTDYNIVVESIANGQVDLAYMGAEGYIEANKKNDKVQAVLTNSGPSGTLDDALYYSFIAVKEENSKEYQDGSGYTLDPIKGKTFSFVSNSSTSGFKVPSSEIVSTFGLNNSDELIIDGDFFDKVLFGGSHQGSAVNLLKGDADAAAFMNMPQYFEVADGEENKAGMLYQVKEGAEAPFDTVVGEQARVILSTPVLNGPFVANTESLSEEALNQIIKAMTSDEVANNEAIFAPKDSDKVGLYSKEDKEHYVEVTDDFYNPIREL